MSDQYETYETYPSSPARRVSGSGTEPEPSERTTIVGRLPTARVVTAPTPPVRIRTISQHEDVVAVAMAASQLIWTIVWLVVVIVLLMVGLQALHVYLHLF